MIDKAKRLERSRKRQQKIRERMAADPEYAAFIRARRVQYDKNREAKNPEHVRAIRRKIDERRKQRLFADPKAREHRNAMSRARRARDVEAARAKEAAYAREQRKRDRERCEADPAFKVSYNARRRKYRLVYEARKRGEIPPVERKPKQKTLEGFIAEARGQHHALI
jgi:hypothetical protein